MALAQRGLETTLNPTYSFSSAVHSGHGATLGDVGAGHGLDCYPTRPGGRIDVVYGLFGDVVRSHRAEPVCGTRTDGICTRGIRVVSVPRCRAAPRRLVARPWSHPRGYQSVQSIYALASGGVLGSGIGQGIPGIVPAAHTDYIFTSIGEELGMVGAVGLLMGYLLLAVRGYGIAMRLTGRFSMFEQLLAVGCTTILAVQTIIIIGGNVRLIPLTGITLPFVSYGGSAVLMNFVVMGLLARLSIHQRDLSESR